jgi:hypothetical protein
MYGGYTKNEAGFWQRRPGFNPSPVLCLIRGEKSCTATRLSQRTWEFPSDSIPQMLHTHSFICQRLYICLPVDTVIKKNMVVNPF